MVWWKWKENVGLQSWFLKKRKLCMQNLMKKWKQTAVVVLQQATFYNIFIHIFILCTYVYLYSSLYVYLYFVKFVFCMYIYIYILFYILYAYLFTYIQGSYIKKNLCKCFRFLWLRTPIPIIRRCSEKCVLQLYRTSLNQIILIIAAIVVKLSYKNEYMTLLSISYYQGTPIIV